MDPTGRFAELVAEGVPHLDEMAFVIARHGRDIDVAEQMVRLDELAGRCPATDAAGLCGWLAADQGFRGNAGEYYDPRNSFLDVVLDRRLGIPITLSLLAIEVGRRCGVDLLPVGMPGHFLVRERANAASFFDPYSRGQPLDPDDCRARFERIHGGQAVFDDSLVAAVDNVAVAQRLLANLHRIYLQRTDRSSLAWVLRLRMHLDGSDPSIRRQLGGVLANIGIFWEAADQFDVLAVLQPDRAEQHRATAERLRARSN